MTKPVITTRADKGSALTWTEGDTNLTNLRDATVTLKAGIGGTDVVSDLNGIVTLVAGTNVTLTGDNTAKTVTIAASSGGGSPAGSDQQIQFNNSGSFGASSSLYYDGVSLKVTSGNIESLYSNGDEGGEFRLATAATNSTLSGGSIAIDINQNRLRFFETGGTTRGAYIDLSSTAAGVATNLLAPDIVNDTTPQLGGDLDVNTYKLVSTANGNITIEPNGTGDVYLTTDTIVVGDANAAVTIKSNGTGQLTLATGNINTASVIVNGNNISLTPYGYTSGAGKTTAYNINYTEYPYANGAVTSLTPVSPNGTVQTVTLTSTSFTINSLSGGAGASVTLILTNNGSVSAITQGTGTWKWAGGLKALTATNGAVDIVSIYFDGTTHYASVNKGFA